MSKDHLVVNLEDILKRKWIKSTTDIGNMRTWSLYGFEAYSSLCMNTVIITSYFDRNNRMVHELDISAGEYGEDGKIIKFPVGTRIWDVKKRAMDLIVEAYELDKWKLYM